MHMRLTVFLYNGNSLEYFKSSSRKQKKYLYATLFAKVGIVSLQQFSFDKLLKWIHQIVTLHSKIQCKEDLLSFISMGTFFADHLVAENAPKRILKQFFALTSEKVFVDTVGQMREEFEGILLFTNVNWLTAKA